MPRFLNLVGLMSAILGAAICALAGFNRILGHFYWFGYESTTLFQVGVALMVFACMVRLYLPENKL